MPALHKRPRRKQDQYAVSREDQYACSNQCFNIVALELSKGTNPLQAKDGRTRHSSTHYHSNEIDIDDLYNNLRVYEDEMKRSSSSTSTSQNLAFLSSENTSSTNEVSSGDFGVTAGGISQIDEDNLEELDLRWQVTMLTVRKRALCWGIQIWKESEGGEIDLMVTMAGAAMTGDDFEIEPVNYALWQISSFKLIKSSDEESTKLIDSLPKQMGYMAIPLLYHGNFLTPRVDISFTGLDEYAIRKKIIESKTTELNTDTSKSNTSETVGNTNEVNVEKPKSVNESVVSTPNINKDKVIIEDWNSDDEDDVSEVQTDSPVKTNETQTVKTRVDKIDQTSQKQGIGFKKIKACFVCKSTDHLIKDCGFGGLREIIGNMCFSDIHAQEGLSNVVPKGISKAIIDLVAGNHTGNSPSISFVRPFEVPLTILNTLDSLGKFDAKSDEDQRQFVTGTGPNWMFDLDFLTNSMNYIPVSVENQVNVDADVAPTAHEKPFKSSPKDNDVQDSEDVADKEGQHQMTEYEHSLLGKRGKFASQKRVAQATSTNKLSTVRSYVSIATTPYVSAASTPTSASSVQQALKLCVPSLKTVCTKDFQMSSKGEHHFFLGLQVKQQPDGIFISQDKYVADILKKFDFWSIGTSTTPIESISHWSRMQMVKMFQVTPKASHLNAVKRIFRYLKHQPKLGLWYPRDSPFELEAFSDSDYGGASLDRKSTTGGCQFLGRRLISWQCKKQTIMANYSYEATNMLLMLTVVGKYYGYRIR
ncbi:putative ribonuclease H-like domain-containing protein [Tanacetum coccineum]